MGPNGPQGGPFGPGPDRYVKNAKLNILVKLIEHKIEIRELSRANFNHVSRDQGFGGPDRGFGGRGRGDRGGRGGFDRGGRGGFNDRDGPDGPDR